MIIKKPKKKQHYVPHMYLNGFCDRHGMVWTYPKNHPNNPYPQKLENVAIEKFFYSLYDLDGLFQVFCIR